jgi:hypothetical protein
VGSIRQQRERAGDKAADRLDERAAQGEQQRPEQCRLAARRSMRMAVMIVAVMIVVVLLVVTVVRMRMIMVRMAVMAIMTGMVVLMNHDDVLLR